jgi:thiosulfate/3-mercaptopyruvate sulfurtransferase
MSRSGVLVDVEELQALRRSSTPLRLLDVRWRLGGPSGHEQFLAGHIPGAIFVDLDRELAGEASPRAGRHPLPSVDRLQAAARRWGLRQGETVVAYDDGGSMSAARAWWLLRWGGVESVFLLDGGLGAWLAAGGQLATGPGLAEPGDVELSPGHMPTVLIDAVAELPRKRSAAGRPGRRAVPGRRRACRPQGRPHPGGRQRADDGEPGRRRPVPPGSRELEARFSRLGARGGTVAIAVYCGSGVTAAHEIAALADRRSPGRPVPGLVVPVEQPRRPPHSQRPLKPGPAVKRRSRWRPSPP